MTSDNRNVFIAVCAGLLLVAGGIGVGLMMRAGSKTTDTRSDAVKIEEDRKREESAKNRLVVIRTERDKLKRMLNLLDSIELQQGKIGDPRNKETREKGQQMIQMFDDEEKQIWKDFPHLFGVKLP